MSTAQINLSVDSQTLNNPLDCVPNFDTPNLELLKPVSKPLLSFKTLGSLVITAGGEEIPSVNFVKRRRILDLLILLILNRKEGLGKDTIFKLFWNNYSERSKKDNLNTLIYRLKQILGPNRELLQIDRSSIYLDPNKSRIDLDTFLQTAEYAAELERKSDYTQAVEYLNTALGLYKGDFLENISTSLPIDEERKRLKEIYLQLLFKAIQLNIYIGNYNQGLIFGRNLTKADPHCEPAYRLVMTALGFLGNTSEAVRIYHLLKENLMDSYGIQPDDKTSLLIKRITLGVLPTEKEILAETSIFY